MWLLGVASCHQIARYKVRGCRGHVITRHNAFPETSFLSLSIEINKHLTFTITSYFGTIWLPEKKT